MESFTPASAAIGGGLIGLSAALLWLADGRIAGISGSVGGLGSASRNDTDWRLAFLLGLVVAPLLYALAAGAPIIAIEAGRDRNPGGRRRVRARAAAQSAALRTRL